MPAHQNLTVADLSFLFLLLFSYASFLAFIVIRKLEIVYTNQDMEELCIRIPHIFTIIFDYLDDQTFVNCRLVNKSWRDCIDMHKFSWIRIIQKYYGDINTYPDTWKKVLEKSTVDITKKLAIAVHNFFLNLLKYSLKPHKRWEPLHIAAEQGHLDLCKYIMEKIGDFKALTKHIGTIVTTYISTPLHFAAGKGHMDVCQLMIGRMVDKNPATLDSDLWTPLHFAARFGHLEICR